MQKVLRAYPNGEIIYYEKREKSGTKKQGS